MANVESVGLEWYETGTVTLTQGSTAVTGVGTNWESAGIKIGDIFTVDRSVSYMIQSVNSNTSLTLKQAYAGASGNTLNYYIIRNFAATLTSQLSAQVSKQNAIYQTWIDGRVTEVAIPFDFSSLYKVTWASGRAYKVLDIVMYDSALYVCVVAHTSTTSITPANKTYWLSYAPQMPAGVDIFNYNSDATHNKARGKLLGTSFTDAQSTAIKGRHFTDIYLNDYWDVKDLSYEYPDPDTGEATTATYSGTFRIYAMNYYMGVGYKSVLWTPHIVVIPDVPMFQAPMNATDTTAGGYLNSAMRTKYLARAQAIFEAFFGADNVLSYQDVITNAVKNNVVTGVTWTNCKVELPDERQFFGSRIYSTNQTLGTVDTPQTTASCKLLPLALLHPELAIYARRYTWLRNIAGDTKFSMVNNLGVPSKELASVAHGVRPFALIS